MENYRVFETKGEFYIEKFEQTTFCLIPIGKYWYRTNLEGNAVFGTGYKYNSLDEAINKAKIFNLPDKIHEL
jgi:hypothetical protein